MLKEIESNHQQKNYLFISADDSFALESDVKQVINTTVGEILLFIQRQVSEITQVSFLSQNNNDFPTLM